MFEGLFFQMFSIEVREPFALGESSHVHNGAYLIRIQELKKFFFGAIARPEGVNGLVLIHGSGRVFPFKHYHGGNKSFLAPHKYLWTPIVFESL